jgi:hypothetical protein
MLSILKRLLSVPRSLVRSRATLVAENLALRHQITILERSKSPTPKLTRWDRALWAFVLRRWSGWKDVLVLVKPATVVSWHRQGFRLFWKRKCQAGRPSVRAEIRRLIREMARDNPTWGAPRIHAELVKVGFGVA